MKKGTIKAAVFAALFFTVCFSAVSAEELTWQQCVDEALANNPGLIAAKASLDRARANSWTTFGNALPQVSVSGGYGKSGTEPLGGPFSYGESYSANLSARQMVFDGLKTFQNMLKAGEDVKASEMSYKEASASARMQLVQAYAGLMKAQELVKISGEILGLRKKQLADIKLRYQAGREHKGSLLSVEADLMQAESDNSQARENLGLAKKSLANTLGRTTEEGLAVKTDFSAATDPAITPDFEKLYDENPGLLMLVAQKNAAANSAGAAISAFLPSISVSAGVGRSAGSLPLEDTHWSIGVNASMSLFDSGILIAQSCAAQASLKQAEALLKQGQLDTMLSLKQAWQDYKNASDNLAVQKKYLQANDERAKISDAQYRNGLLTFDNWTIIQNSLVSSRKSYLNAQAGLLTAEAAWIKAKGGTLEDEKKN
jgi:outer membrane protein TolC